MSAPTLPRRYHPAPSPEQSTSGEQQILVPAGDGHLIPVTWHPATSGGPARRVTVFAHGLFQSSSAWARVTAVLATRYLDPDLAVVTYDHRGHGLADCGPQPLSLDLLASDMATVIGAVRLRRDCAPSAQITLAGHSLGAMTALTLLTDDRLYERAGVIDQAVLASASAGCLACGALLRMSPRIAQVHPETFARVQRILRQTLIPLWSPNGKPVPAVSPPGYEVASTGPEEQCSALSPLAVAQLLACLGAYDLREQLGHRARSKQMPEFTLLCGTNDRITSVAHTRALAQVLEMDHTDVTAVRVVDGAGHSLPTENPTAMALGLA